MGSGQAVDTEALARKLRMDLEAARPLPLLSSQRYLETTVVADALELARRRAGAPEGQTSALLMAVEAVAEALGRAKQVPFTDGLRLSANQVDELVAGLRSAGA